MILKVLDQARFFPVACVLTLSGSVASDGSVIVTRVVDQDTVEVMPATWRRRFAAWVWRRWGER